MRTSLLCQFTCDCIDYKTFQKKKPPCIYTYMNAPRLLSGRQARQHHKQPKQNLASTKQCQKPTLTYGHTQRLLNHSEGTRHTDLRRLAGRPVTKSPPRIPVRECQPPARKLRKKTHGVDALFLSLPYPTNRRATALR